MNMLKRFLSLALAIVLVLGCVPTLAFAEEQSVTAAKIGEATFASLEAAFAAAQDGDTITVQSDLELAAGIVNTKQVTLNLNGKTVSYTSNVPGEDMITNRGKLTITDTDGGKLTYVNTDATAANVTVSTISAEPGSELILENGTIENKSVKADGSSIYPFAIDVLTNGTLGDVSVTINDGTVYSDYIAIRQFNNGTACKNELTINGGYIYGGKRGIQTHMANNAAYTTITGGKVEAGDYALCLFATEAPAVITGGEFVGMVYSATSGIVYGGSFNDAYVSEYIAAGCNMQQNADGTYGVSINLPSATISYISNPELTFALNFKADEATAAQLDAYGNWYADFVLTSNKDIVLNADGSADGWLSGQYDEWSKNWVSVPFGKYAPTTLKAGESLKIMEYAAKLMGEPGLKYTYAEVYEFVKDFDCGMFLTPEFLAANPDIQVTLELRMYNPADETQSVGISEVYVFEIPSELPSATVTYISNPDLTFALNFKADEATAQQLAFYGSWYADFVLTSNKDIVMNADGSADGWLSGQYDEWSKNWVNVPFGNKAPVTIKAGESLKIMEFAAQLMGEPGLKYTYAEVYDVVKDFDCGMFLDAEFLAANPDIEITLELRLYNPKDESESYSVSDLYVFTLPELPSATVSYISNPELTFALNFKADAATDAQLGYYGAWYADFVLTSNKDIVMNADGSADGWLSGQYDEWSKNWVNVPFGNKAPVTLKAGESLKIMEFAAELMGEPGLKYTYAEVYEVVKDFDCGMLLDAEFLAANPDIEITLELRLYNPKDESESYSVSDLYVFTLPELPSATVSYISNPELTFALNFKADAATDAQLGYYGAWYADFVLTSNKDIVMNADGSADGWLSGQYDEWSKNWVNVPFGNKAPVTLKAGESLKIMEFAAELMGEPGLKYTYAEVYEVVKDFDCGMFLTPEFLAANPDIEITLELRLYNPKDESESYSVSDLYVFTLPELPTATTTEITNPELTFAMNFKADAATEQQLAYYGAWYADFVLTSNKDIVMNADGSADGWLSGQYDAWSKNWVNVPFGNKAPVTLKAGESLKIMEFAAQLMGEPGLKYTYAEVYDVVKDFDCGMFFDNEFIMANPDLEVTLELRLYNPKDESVSYVIGDTYVFTLPEYVAYNETTDTLYTTLADAIAAAQAGDKINLLNDVTIDEQIDVNTAVTVDLNTFKVTATSKKAFAVYADATFQNGTIEAAQRAIDTRTAVELNLTDLELIATSLKYGNAQPLTVGGSDNGTVVNMNNVTIEAGIDGYSIITFVETELNITDSTLNGFSNIYVKDGSAGSVITLTNTALTSITNDPLDMFAAIVTEANDITVTADAASSITADDGAFGFTADRTNVEITFAGDITANTVVMGWNENLTVIVPEALTAQIEGEGLATEATETEGLVLIVLTTYVAEVNGTKYTTLQAAIDACGNEANEIIILESFEMTDSAVVGAAQNITLNLNGKTITGTPVASKAYAVIQNAGTLVIEGEGSIICNHTLAGSTAYAVNTIVNSGNLTVNGGEIVNTSTAANQIGYAIDNNSTTGNAVLTINGGSVTASGSNYYDAVRLFANSLTKENSVTVTGGEVSSIWMQNPSDGAAGKNNLDVLGSVTVTGGEIGGLYLEPSAGFTAAISGGIVHTLGEFNVEADDADKIPTKFVSGGYFDSIVLDKYCAEGYVPTTEPEDNGMYTVTQADYVAHNIQTDKYYETVSGAMLEAEDGQTVEVIKDCTDRVITIKENTTLDLNGFTVTANYVACYGDLVDYTEDNSGLLIVTKTRFFIREDNAQLPVRDGEGYRFVEIIKYNQAVLNNGTKYAFQPLFEENAHALLANGIEATGVTIRVLVSWKDGSDIRTQEFLYTDEYVNGFIDSYKPATGKYSKMFTLTLNGAEDFQDLTFVATVVSEVGVSFRAD